MNRKIQPRLIHDPNARMWIIGHRGYPTRAPENTISSFARAVAAGVHMIEFDVTLSADGVPVVIHDRTLNRTTNGRGDVKRRTLEQLKRLDAGSWYSPVFVGEVIPTLDEVLRTFSGKVAMNIEIKPEAVRRGVLDGIERKVVEAIHFHGVQSNVVVSSFSSLAVKRVKQTDSELSAALLFARIPRRFPRVALLALRVADAVHLPLRGLRRESVARFRDLGFPVRVFTVNRNADFRNMMDWGVTGIFTDQPERWL